MKPVLFLASLRDSWKSILIFCIILFLFGLGMMLIFPQMDGMMGDPMAEADGIALAEMPAENEEEASSYNLTWDLRAGAGEHLALGTADPLTYELIKGFIEEGNTTDAGSISPDLFLQSLNNETALGEYGIEMLYYGSLNYVEFTPSGNSSFFFVVYLAGGGNFTPVGVSKVISNLDLVLGAQWSEWLESPFVEGFIGRTDVDFTTPEGFMAVEFFSMWPMFFLIYIGIKSGGSVAPHVEDKSLDILLATGYSRNRFLGEKLGYLGVNMIAVLLAGLLGILAGAVIIGESIDVGALTVAFAGSIPVGIAFIGIGMVLSVLIDEGMKVTWVIMGLVVGMYIIDIITNVVDAMWADILGYTSLFYFYDAITLMIDQAVPIQHLIVPTVVGSIGIVGAFYLFKKKEIHA